MNFTKIIALIFGIFGSVGGLVLNFPEKLSICGANDITCLYNISEGVGQPVFFIFFPALIMVIISLFFSKEIFQSLVKFFAIFIIFEIVLISQTSISCGGIFCFDRELVTWICSISFLAISLAIIITKSILLRKKK